MKKLSFVVAVAFTLTVANKQLQAQASDWLWVKSDGGAKYDRGRDISTDASGNVYVTGVFASDSITFGSTTLINADTVFPESFDVFIVKYDANSNVIWAKSAGGTSYDDANSISTDVSGNVYVTGNFRSDSITFGNTTFTGTGIFVVKYDTHGNVIWAKSPGGTGIDAGYGISTDANGNVYVTGNFGRDPITFGNTSLTHPGIFVLKYDANGNGIWARSAGGNEGLADTGKGITTDKNGNVYVIGTFDSDTIAFGSTILIKADTVPESFDIFIVKYDVNGNIIWAKSAGKKGIDFGSGISTDTNNNVYVTGSFRTDSIKFGSITLTGPGFFLVKYDTDGNVIWAKNAGGTDRDKGTDISTDTNNNVYVTGSFLSDSITFGNMTLTNTNPGYVDFFIVKYNTNGNVIWAKATGGTEGDEGNGISTDVSGNVYVTGGFGSPSIIFGNATVTNAGSDDVFVGSLANCFSFFELYPDTIPHRYYAVNMASGTSPLSYSWDWGDGSTDAVPFPSHTYDTAGFYTICLAISDGLGCTDTFCNSYNLLKTSNAIVEVNIIPPLNTGVTENSVGELLLFPNPATNYITVELLKGSSMTEFKIFDILGKLELLSNTIGQKSNIDISGLTSGIYILEVRADKNIIRQKFIKE